MRAPIGLAIVVAAVCVGAGLVACFDLFHSTTDILTACQIDAQTPGCGDAEPEAAAEAGVDFCAWSSPTPRNTALRVCAWLGACETPMGRNALGPCMLEALLAYDCAANPNHPVRGKTYDLWACLASAQSCAAIDACVFPVGPQSCKETFDYTSCGTATGPTGDNDDVRVECNDGGVAHGENCALWGQTCETNGAVGVCAAGRGDAGLPCSRKECVGSALHWCVDGGDIGMDCADNGAGSCGGFPSTALSWLACLPSSDAGSCAPDVSAQCASGIASSCPAGVPESVDCDELLQAPDACVPGPLSPPFDWTSACRVDVRPDSGPCVESCGGSIVNGCVRGAPVAVDCTSVGLGPCQMVTTDDGTAMHPACTP